MFRRLRILILLLILATVATTAWRTERHLRSWRSTLHVAVFALNADGSTAARDEVHRLEKTQLAPIADYIAAQAAAHGMDLTLPVRIETGPEITTLPPEQPASGGMLAAIRWSLAIRYWAWRHTPETSIRPDLRLYLLYHDPERNPRVPDSAGLAKGGIALAHVFAGREMAGSNLVVATHELLHTLGATDKYDPATNLALHPEGYAEPWRKPRLPQTQAEIMAGRIPLRGDTARIPASLAETVIGPATAREIGWSTDTH
ncbi:MAG: hypothetical protein CGU28_06215 [Candidatus Dactylopiibacterium carminicum]|uniref:Uncharacterized protein n=1 Tax=Candidatus Dactylopiibacterium carminicum TaxID=857335 RepID=A0A272ET30_9RHOO|nr:hypothetical protein [Candidatus Dactylopiibacterium carminicum]KAF7599166.1 hypothetical protein BGI27_09295 [Candidatus Dactylopiibacterium carminicum]PAS93262.1 MAG: hypothetical protein CGU29_08460 [Candidatus Dactylopiibacterium carminicum]PAS97103.1 MAG: hypothetical protein CGU28_06215 [Candidatus Dactylopiibacterium carminicum]PAS99180.1 MAG: hypothetical protein BSR46_09305 [Candidatus Dactylopiibacterium carminicum]